MIGSLWDTPEWPFLLIFMSLYKLPLLWAVPSDWLLIKEYGKGEGMLFPWVCYKMLWLPSCWETFSLVNFDETSNMLQRPTWQGIEALSPTLKEPNSASNHKVHLEADLCPEEVWLQPCEWGWSRGPMLTITRLLTHRCCEISNMCYFKPLSFGVICYATISN